MARLLDQALNNRALARVLRGMAPTKSIVEARQALLRYAQLLDEEADRFEAAAQPVPAVAMAY